MFTELVRTLSFDWARLLFNRFALYVTVMWHSSVQVRLTCLAIDSWIDNPNLID